MNSPMMKVAEVAELLGVHVNTVKRLDIPFYRITARGDRRYLRTDVETWLEAHRKNDANDHNDL